MFTLHAQSGFPWKNQGQPLSQSPFSFREQSFKRWEIPMILSVLSSPALVSGLMVVRAKNPVHSVLFSILVFCDTSGLLILLGLDFSAMIFPVVHIGAIAVSFLFVASNRILTLCWGSIYTYFYLYFPRKIWHILLCLYFSLLVLRLLFLIGNLTSALFETAALVFALSYHGASAQAYQNMMFFGDDDLSRAVAPYLPRGGPAPLNIPEGRPLTIGEEERLALVLNYHQSIGAILKWIDAPSLITHRLEQESNEDLAAATLLHKDEDIHDPDKLWVVREGILRDGNSSRYYWRAVHWAVTEQKVRNGDLSPSFIIEDDGEG
jgi:hypothetical protein